MGDIFLTCTGQTSVIARAHFLVMKNGAMLGNCGHFDLEIDVKQLENLSKSKIKIKENVNEFKLKEKSLFLLCEGRVVNLIAGEGHPPEVMQLSCANQLLSIDYLVSNRAKLRNLSSMIRPFPTEIDALVAKFALQSFNLRIDKLTRQQRNYASSFIR